MLSESPHALPAAEVAAAHAVDLETGLSEGEAAARLAAVGPNALRRPVRPAYLRIALRQVLDPLVALLIGATVVSAAIGETIEAGAIAAIVVLNAIFGFVQEVGAERAVLALHASLE